MARSLQHLMRKACSSIQSKASCLLAYEEKGRRIQPFPSQQTKAESHLARKPECASAHFLGAGLEYFYSGRLLSASSNELLFDLVIRMLQRHKQRDPAR